MQTRRISILLLGLLASAPAWGQALRYAEDKSPGIVNPVYTTSMSEARLNELLFEGLYIDNTELMSVPALAEASELSDDKTQMTIRLRYDVRWHDGVPFTAKNVAVRWTSAGKVLMCLRATDLPDRGLRIEIG